MRRGALESPEMIYPPYRDRTGSTARRPGAAAAPSRTCVAACDRYDLGRHGIGDDAPYTDGRRIGVNDAAQRLIRCSPYRTPPTRTARCSALTRSITAGAGM